MNIILDTHAFLWFISGDSKLSKKAKRAIELSDNQILISIASLWEIGIKISIGKLTLTEPFEMFIPQQMEFNGFNLLHIEIGHIAQVLSLPFHHRDPFDRMLVAQCAADNLTIISRDSVYDLYNISRLW